MSAAPIRGRFWVTEPTDRVDPVLGPGVAGVPPKTVIDVFHSTVQRHGSRPAMCLKRKAPGAKEIPREWKVWTWQQYWDDCRKFAKTLISLEVEKFRVVNILGFNSPEWFIANTGSIFAGCIAAGIYTTNISSACHYISQHSQAEVVVVEGNKQLEKYAAMEAGSLPFLKAIVVWNETIDPALAERLSWVRVFQWEEFLEIGTTNGVNDSVIEVRQSSVLPGNCSTLIYTSGTTGPPKAVMVSHDNITWITYVLGELYLNITHQERVVSYLPLSHIAGQIIDIHAPMLVGAATYFCQPDALKGSLTQTMRDVRPTFFFGVPRVWEKIQEKMVQMGRENTGYKKHLSAWVKKIGLDHSKRSQFGAGGGAPCGYSCANSLVLSKIKEALGLDQARFCFTSAAPISEDTLWYFASLDIPLYEAFGQSECTGPHTVCMPGSWKIGSCGRPILGSQSKIDGNTGELCYRGRHIFMGYMYNPGHSSEAIDDEGYLHSGDVAVFDRDEDPRVQSPSGFMRITGRIKELIITAGGENIPPVLIENEMKAAMVALSNCMVIGDKRKYLTMLVSLKVEVDKDTGAPTDQLAADSLFVGNQIGSSARTVAEAAACPLWTKYINDGMKAANRKTTSNAQIVQKWRLLSVDFSEKAGDLTPTLKLKRKVVTDKYAELIESMYAESGDA